MAKNNPQNQYTRDETATRADVPMPIQRATVIDAQADTLHRVTVDIYGTSTTETATVLVPMYGTTWVPEEGTDVMVLYGADDTPYIIGAWYAEDKVDDGYVDIPDYDVGDLRIGNNTGSHVTINNDNSIQIITEGNAPVDIDVQSATVVLAEPQTIPSGEIWTQLEHDVVVDDNDNLWDETTHSMNARHGGMYQIHGDVAWKDAGQNNNYELGIFINGQLVKRKYGQSTISQPLSMNIMTNKLLESGDVIDIRVRNLSGSNKTIDGNETTTEFSVNRTGRRRGDDAV